MAGDNKRDALLAMHVQTGEAQRAAVRQAETQQPSDKMHATISRTVSDQERRAREVFTVSMSGFFEIKPSTEAEMRRADSQLLRFRDLSQG